MGWPAALLETGQTGCYSVFDDGDQELGVAKGYTIIATPGNTNIEVAHYACATITFAAADDSITDAAALLVTFLSADTIVIKGSTSNDGTYTIAAGTGGVAGHFHTNEPLADEAAGAVVSFYKMTAHSNNVVQDTKAGRMWSRYGSVGEKVGNGSTGFLFWSTTTYMLHNAVGTMSVIMPGNIIRILAGAAEVNWYHVGDLIVCANFVNAVNNGGGYVESVTVNGANLDIVVDPGNNVLIAEAATGRRTFLVCRTIFNYAAGARLGGLAGYTDWRVPNAFELPSLLNEEGPTGVPDAVAFPGWTVAWSLWSSTTVPNNVGQAIEVSFLTGTTGVRAKTSADYAALVRS